MKNKLRNRETCFFCEHLNACSRNNLATIFQIQSRPDQQHVLEYQMNLCKMCQFILNILQIKMTILETIGTDMVLFAAIVVFTFAVN